MSEGRPTSARRGYDAKWRKRRDEQLGRQPWCEMHADAMGIPLSVLEALAVNLIGSPRNQIWQVQHGETRRVYLPLADTVDHRKRRITFPPELRGSDAPGGSEHPDNFRSLCHSCHSRRPDDKARRAR